jgi:hypothetical protein
MDAQTGLDLALEGRELDERWLGLCPPIYRETDIHRLPPEAAKVTQWQYGPRGLVVVGPTGVGKTRAMWLLLKRLVYEGRHVRALNAVEFANRCADAFMEGRGTEWTRKLAELYLVVERRVAHGRPILVTTNLTGRAYVEGREDDGERAAATVRRLREFCDTVVLSNGG